MALREILAKFGYETDDKKLVEANKKVDAFSSKLKEVAGYLAAGAFASKIKGWVEETRSMGDTLAKNAVRLGIDAHALQQWQVAADHAGLSAEEINTAMKMLQKNAASAVDGISGLGDDLLENTNLKGVQGAFQTLGISIKDTTGKIKPVPDLMRDVGLAIAGIDDPAKRTQISLQIFGRQGTRLATLFSDGAEGLEQALASLDKFGGGLSDDLLPLAESYTDRLTEMNVATLSLKSVLAKELFPILIAGVKYVSGFITKISKISKDTNIVKATLIALTGTLLIFKGAAIATGIKAALAWAPLIIAFAAIGLLIEDLITLFEGGDSAIGRLLDSILGMGGAKKTVEIIKTSVADMSTALSDMGITGPKALGLVAAALVGIQIAASPVIGSILAVGAAIGVVTAAVTTFNKLDRKSKGQGMPYWWVNAKHNLGITSDQEYLQQRMALTGETERDINLEGMSSSERASLEAFEARSPSTAAAMYAPENYASSAYAPTVAAMGGEGATYNIDIRNQNHFDTKVTASGDASSVADAVRDGQNQSLNDDRNATVAALETLAP